MTGPSPTSRTLAWCRKRGWFADKVEYWLDLHQPDDLAFAAFGAVSGLWGLAKIREVEGDPLPLERLQALADYLKAAYPSMTKERWQGGPIKGLPGRRIDWGGFVDIFALDGKPGIAGIQASRGADLSTRMTKAKAIPECKRLLEAGNRMLFFGWRKVKVPTKAGGTVERWRPRIVSLTWDGESWGTEGRIQERLDIPFPTSL